MFNAGVLPTAVNRQHKQSADLMKEKNPKCRGSKQLLGLLFGKSATDCAPSKRPLVSV